MRAAANAQALRLMRAITATVSGCAAAPTDGNATNGSELRLIVEDMSAQDWASATFTGALHRLDLRLEGRATAVVAALAVLQRVLPNADIPIPGHFVADIALTLGDPIHDTDSIRRQPFNVNALVLQD